MVRNLIQWGLIHGFPQWDFHRDHLQVFLHGTLRFSQVGGGSVDILEGRGVVYGTGEGHRSPDGVGVPRESQNAFSHEDMIPEGSEEDLASSEEDGSQDEGSRVL